MFNKYEQKINTFKLLLINPEDMKMLKTDQDALPGKYEEILKNLETELNEYKYLLIQMEKDIKKTTEEIEMQNVEIEDLTNRVEEKKRQLSTGIKGIQSPPGIPGSDGKPGPDGPDGLKGFRGQKGDIGGIGLPGLAGVPGRTVMELGETGKQGPIGVRGVEGPVGKQGLKGSPGDIISKDGLIDFDQLRGDPGDFGIIGYPGYSGIPGPKGLLLNQKT